MDLAEKADEFIGEQPGRTYSEKEVIELMRTIGKGKTEPKKAFIPTINALSKKISKAVIGSSENQQKNPVSTTKEIPNKKVPNKEISEKKGGQILSISIP